MLLYVYLNRKKEKEKQIQHTQEYGKETLITDACDVRQKRSSSTATVVVIIISLKDFFSIPPPMKNRN